MLKRNPLSFCTLVLAVLALSLAVMPRIALHQPVPEPAPENWKPLPANGSGVTVRIKGLSVTFGAGDADEQETAPAPPPVIEPRAQWLKYFMLATAGCSLSALLIGPLAWVREKQPAISGTAVAIAAVALTWQYIVLGIAAAVAILVLLFLLSLFG